MPLALKNDIEAIYEEQCVQGGFRPDQGPCPYMNMIWRTLLLEDSQDTFARTETKELYVISVQIRG